MDDEIEYEAQPTDEALSGEQEHCLSMIYDLLLQLAVGDSFEPDDWAIH